MMEILSLGDSRTNNPGSERHAPTTQKEKESVNESTGSNACGGASVLQLPGGAGSEGDRVQRCYLDVPRESPFHSGDSNYP